MKSSLKNQIHQKIADYLLEKMTLKDLEDWLIPTTWDLREEPDKKAVDLANEVVLLLMEYSNEHRTESEIREILREKVTHIFASVTIDEKNSPYIVSASSSQADMIIELQYLTFIYLNFLSGSHSITGCVSMTSLTHSEDIAWNIPSIRIEFVYLPFSPKNGITTPCMVLTSFHCTFTFSICPVKNLLPKVRRIVFWHGFLHFSF